MDQAIRDKYTAVIGLEVHAQLLTQSKIYSSDSTRYGNAPNTNVSTVTLAHPGTLPKLNKKAVEYAIKMGIVCNCEINRYNLFDRKNYFYPDLPKGYQITQDKNPICKGGELKVTLSNDREKNIQLTKIHIEEDAGKSVHQEGEEDTLVDFNRSGVPLIEIVTEPDIRSSEEAGVFLSEIRKIVRYLEICDGNMEEGSLRCDANVSVMPAGERVYGKKVEVKNMNSIRNVQRAIDQEIERQISLLENGEQIYSETRTFDAANGTTHSMRTKEELNDYRYFPDPDLSPLTVSDNWLEEIKKSMPTLPNELFLKFTGSYKLPAYDASILTEDKNLAAYFEELVTHTANYKAASNWMMGPVKSYLNDESVSIVDFPVKPAKIATIIELIDKNKISFAAASQQLLPNLISDPFAEPGEKAERLDLIQQSDIASLEPIIDQVIASNPKKVEEYRKGKKGLLGMFIGEVMKNTNGKADPKVTSQQLKDKLEKE